MGRMKEQTIKDVPKCRTEPTPSYSHVGEFKLKRVSLGLIGIQHVSGEWGLFNRPVFERDVCPWDSLPDTENVEEKVREFYGRNF